MWSNLNCNLLPNHFHSSITFQISLKSWSWPNLKALDHIDISHSARWSVYLWWQNTAFFIVITQNTVGTTAFKSVHLGKLVHIVPIQWSIYFALCSKMRVSGKQFTNWMSLVINCMLTSLKQHCFCLTNAQHVSFPPYIFSLLHVKVAKIHDMSL